MDPRIKPGSLWKFVGGGDGNYGNHMVLASIGDGFVYTIGAGYLYRGTQDEFLSQFRLI